MTTEHPEPLPSLPYPVVFLIVLIAIGVLPGWFFVGSTTRGRPEGIGLKEASPKPSQERASARQGATPVPAPAVAFVEGVLLPQEKAMADAGRFSPGRLPKVEPPTAEEFPASVPRSREAILDEAKMVATSAVDRYPESPLALAVLGTWQVIAGQTEEAEQTWRKVLAADNRFLDAYTVLMDLAEGRGDHTEVARLARLTIEIAPQRELGYLRLAEALCNQGRDEEAAALLEEYCSASQAPSLEMRKRLAKAWLTLGEYRKAENVLWTIPDAVDDSEVARLRADLAATQGDMETAEKYLQQASVMAASASTSAEPTGDASLTPEVAKLLEEVAKLETKAAKMYYVYRDFIRTEIYLRRALALDSRCREARRALVAFYQEQGRYSQMERVLEDWLPLEPENLRIYVTLAACYGARRDFEKTEAILKDAIGRFPDNPLPWGMLAKLYIDAQQKAEESVKLARKVVVLQPIAINYQLLAEALEVSGQIEEALRAIEEAIKKDPQQPQFRAVQERLLQKAGKKLVTEVKADAG